MENYFRELSEKIFAQLQGPEVLLLNYSGEDTDFTRFNQNKIRQAGHVRQQGLQLDLIANQRQCHAAFELSGDLRTDVDHALQLLRPLREQLALLPEDPYLNYALEPQDTFHVSENQLPTAEQAVAEIIHSAQDLDLVGIWASGAMSRGFANSLGQFNWHTDYNFNFDWSVYQQGDKAVKQSYAGFQWNPEFLQQKLAFARQTLPLLHRQPVTIKPGRYRAFLSPVALQEIFGLLNWGGFGLKSHRTAQTPLIKMVKEGARLSPQVHIIENHRDGLVPSFSTEGFIMPNTVSLIESGVYQQCLANQRSAKEYGTIEHPRSMEVRGGDLHQDRVLNALDTGIYISNLWYCNYSDRNNARITGMTRFACLWVEKGVPVAPLNVMRFDESVLNMLGPNLVALTEEREHIFDSSTYNHRSDTSWKLPGALVDNLTFTL